MKTTDLIELVVKELNITPYEIAKRLEIQTNRIYTAKKGNEVLSIDHLFTMCEWVNVDPLLVIPDVLAARAKRPREKQLYERMARLAALSERDNCILCKIATPSLIREIKIIDCKNAPIFSTSERIGRPIQFQ